MQSITNEAISGAFERFSKTLLKGDEGFVSTVEFITYAGYSIVDYKFTRKGDDYPGG